MTVAARGKLNLIFKFAGPKGAPAVRREAEEYWGNGVVLTRLPGIHTDGHAPSLEAAKAEWYQQFREGLVDIKPFRFRFLCGPQMPRIQSRRERTSLTKTSLTKENSR